MNATEKALDGTKRWRCEFNSKTHGGFVVLHVTAITIVGAVIECLSIYPDAEFERVYVIDRPL